MSDGELYEALGIPKDADAATIKRAYRRKAAESHPDGESPDPDRFALVCLAKDVLTDQLRRKRYDDAGDTTKKSETAEILEVISQAMDFVLLAADQQGFDITTVLMIPALVQRLGQMVEEVDTKLAPARRSIEQHTRLMSRFEPTDGEPNAIDEMIRKKVGQIEEALAPLVRQRELMVKAQAMLSAYSYRTEPASNFWPGTGFYSAQPMGGAWR